MKRYSEPVVDLMLDSGAFSAWLRGVTIPIKDYIAYVKRWEHILGCYISLDVIPGTHGIARTTEEGEISSEATYKNHQIMRDAGLSPIPVFHQGEDPERLLQYIEDGEDYIAISPWKDVPASVQRAWLDKAFTMLTDKHGRPYVKVHGFATTNPPLLFRYPFYSVDSTTWSLGPGYGQIILPNVTSTPDSEWNWRTTPLRFVMSGIMQSNPAAALKATEYIERGHGIYYGIVDRWLKECDMDFGDMRNHPNHRRRVALLYFMQLAKHVVIKKFKHRMENADKWQQPGEYEPIKVQPLKIMFATSFKNKPWGEIMTEIGANTRLLSYWETRERSDKEFEQFILTGRCFFEKRERKARGQAKNVSRRVNDAEKRKIILEALKPGAELNEIAEKHGINGTTLSNWRNRYMTSTISLKWKRSSYVSARAMSLIKRLERYNDESEGTS